MGIIGGKEIIFPGKNIVDAGPSGLNQQRGGDAAARRHAAEVERFLNMFSVSVPCPETGGLMRGVAEHPSHLLSVQARGATGGGCCAKKRRNAVGAPVAFGLKTLTAEGNRETRPDIVTKSDGAQKPLAANPKALPGG